MAKKDIERLIKEIESAFKAIQAYGREIRNSLYEYTLKRNRLVYNIVDYLSREHDIGDYYPFVEEEGEVALDLVYKALRSDDELLEAYDHFYSLWEELDSYNLSDEESEEYFPTQWSPKVNNITEFEEYYKMNLYYFSVGQEQMLATFEKRIEPADRIKPLF